MTTKNNRLIGTKEAAKILSMEQDSLKRLARLGRIPAKKVGKSWVFQSEEVENYRPSPVGNPNFQKKKATKH